MKISMLVAMVVFASSANAAGPSPSHTYSSSGDISANAPCSHPVEISPDEVGYSVSARRAAENVAATGGSTPASRSSVCGPSSVGYTLSAQKVAAERQLYEQSESVVNNSVLHTNSTLPPPVYSTHIPVSTARIYSANSPANVPQVYNPASPLVPQYRYLGAQQMYTPYGQSYSSGARSARTGEGGRGSRRVGGVGSSGKGSRYVDGTGRR